MIGRISGILLEKTPPQVQVDANGVGYDIDVPMSTFYNLPRIGEKVILFTHLVVREDAHLLFGFGSESERAAFRTLIKPIYQKIVKMFGNFDLDYKEEH